MSQDDLIVISHNEKSRIFESNGIDTYIKLVKPKNCSGAKVSFKEPTSSGDLKWVLYDNIGMDF